jgi:hypothetical protein
MRPVACISASETQQRANKIKHLVCFHLAADSREPLLERFSLDKLHHDIRVPFSRKEITHRDDSGQGIKLSQRLRLVIKRDLPQ